MSSREAVTRPRRAKDENNKGKTRRSSQSPTTATSGEKGSDAPEWIIRGGTSSKSRLPPDWIIRGQLAGRRSGLEHPGRNKQQEPPPPGLDHPGAGGG